MGSVFISDYHTQFFATESEAVVAHEEMKPALAEILARLPADDEDVKTAMNEGATILDHFITRFP